MGKRKNTYRTLTKLPAKAQSVAQYAANRGCDTSNIYKIWRTKKGKNKTEDFEIVQYQGLNFVIAQ